MTVLDDKLRIQLRENAQEKMNRTMRKAYIESAKNQKRRTFSEYISDEPIVILIAYVVIFMLTQLVMKAS